MSTPTITVEPLYTDAILELRRAVTNGRLLIQIGGGVLSGGVLNTCAIAATQASPLDANPADENGRIRNSLQLKCTDSGATGNYFQFARA